VSYSPLRGFKALVLFHTGSPVVYSQCFNSLNQKHILLKCVTINTACLIMCDCKARLFWRKPRDYLSPQQNIVFVASILQHWCLSWRIQHYRRPVYLCGLFVLDCCQLWKVSAAVVMVFSCSQYIWNVQTEMHELSEMRISYQVWTTQRVIYSQK
jgi:hypothetical protein